jgi:ClpP class serine protease
MFTQKAAKGRNLPLAQLLKLASGRVWSGQQAQQNGLIDQLGGLQDTIDLAIKRTDLKVEPTIVSYPRPRSFFESLQEISSNTPRQLPYTPAQALSAISHLPLAYVHAIKPLLLASNSPLLAWHPLPHIKW